LAKGDGPSAAVFLGGALAEDPAHGEALFLLDGLFARTSDPLSLSLPDDEDGLSVGETLVRVQALARANRVADALVLLAAMGAVHKEKPYLAWTAPLLASAAPLDEEALASVLGAWASGFSGVTVEAAEAVLLGHADPLLERAEVLGRPRLLLLAASLLRKRGDVDRAISFAVRAHAAEPSWATCVALAMIHRAAGDFDEAVVSYQEALVHRPDDVTARLDLADLYGEASDWKRAHGLYEDVLARAPGHLWAAPSALFARLEAGDRSARAELEAFAHAHPDNARAAALVARATPFLGWLPEPVAPLVQAGLRLAVDWEKQAPAEDTPVAVTLETEPTPSSVWSFYMLLVRHRIETPPSVAVRHPPPAPWAPEQNPRVKLWRGTPLGPLPGLPEAPEEIAEAIGTIARQRFDLAAWGEFADVVVAHVTPLGLAHALAVMVRPPPVPEHVPPWTWLTRVQIAAALVAVRLPGGIEALLDVLWGPDDGTVEAAGLALADAARRETDQRLVVSDALFKRLQASAPDASVRFPLVCAWLLVPGVPDEVRAVLAEYRASRLG
jgi:tetratricopeptide (TPR) repeat protein